MFLLVSGARRPYWCSWKGHQHGVSMQSFINLGKPFFSISRIWNISQTWFLARVFVYLSFLISQILVLLYWMVCIFVFHCMTASASWELTFSAFRMGAYSRWAVIRGRALIRINTVVKFMKKNLDRANKFCQSLSPSSYRGSTFMVSIYIKGKKSGTLGTSGFFSRATRSFVSRRPKTRAAKPREKNFGTQGITLLALNVNFFSHGLLLRLSWNRKPRMKSLWHPG